MSAASRLGGRCGRHRRRGRARAGSRRGAARHCPSGGAGWGEDRSGGRRVRRGRGGRLRCRSRGGRGGRRRQSDGATIVAKAVADYRIARLVEADEGAASAAAECGTAAGRQDRATGCTQLLGAAVRQPLAGTRVSPRAPTEEVVESSLCLVPERPRPQPGWRDGSNCWRGGDDPVQPQASSRRTIQSSLRLNTTMTSMDW